MSTLLTPSGSSAYSPADAFKLSIPIRNNYMYARVRKALPELYAFSVCMWLRSRSGGTGQGTPFSYSVPGQANEIVLLEAGHDPMELLINDKVRGGERVGGGRGGALSGAPVLCWALSVLLLSRISTHEMPGVCQAGFGDFKTSQTWGCEEELMSKRGCQRWCATCRGACEAHRGSEASPAMQLWEQGCKCLPPGPCSFFWTKDLSGEGGRKGGREC